MRAFGITIEQYEEMWERQGGKCANTQCRAEFPKVVRDHRNALHVDHDHATGKVRALLCPGCNSALGRVKDDGQRLIGLAEYLLVHKGTS